MLGTVNHRTPSSRGTCPSKGTGTVLAEKSIGLFRPCPWSPRGPARVGVVWPCDSRRRAHPTGFLGWCASQGTVRPGRAEHLLGVRVTGGETALRPPGNRGVEGRGAPR